MASNRKWLEWVRGSVDVQSNYVQSTRDDDGEGGKAQLGSPLSSLDFAQGPI